MRSKNTISIAWEMLRSPHTLPNIKLRFAGIPNEFSQSTNFFLLRIKIVVYIRIRRDPNYICLVVGYANWLAETTFRLGCWRICAKWNQRVMFIFLYLQTIDGNEGETNVDQKRAKTIKFTVMVNITETILQPANKKRRGDHEFHEFTIMITTITYISILSVYSFIHIRYYIITLNFTVHRIYICIIVVITYFFFIIVLYIIVAPYTECVSENGEHVARTASLSLPMVMKFYTVSNQAMKHSQHRNKKVHTHTETDE